MALPDPDYIQTLNDLEEGIIDFPKALYRCKQLTFKQFISYRRLGLSEQEAFEKALKDITGKENYGRLLA
jgi:protein-arginine kinase activator protein McsA